MNEQPGSSKGKKANFAMTILLTGLFAGTLDILAALCHAYFANGVTPARVFQYIASGVLGFDAFSGGANVVILGLAMHFFIAEFWTALYFTLYPKIAFLSKNRAISGIVYGVFVWGMMNLIVLPLTSIPKSSFSVTGVLIGAGILILMIGLPISISAYRYYAGR